MPTAGSGCAAGASRQSSFLIVLSLALATFDSGDARSDAYPTRTVTIVVPIAAGTGVDTITRAYGEQLARSLGKPVIIENRPGAATMLGTGAVATAQPDGHTLLVATSSAMAINQVLYKKISYDPVADFVPIAFYLKSPFVLIARSDLPVHSIRDLIRYASEKPTPLTFSSPGAGTAQHLSVEFLKQRFGIRMTHVPYRSNPQSIADVVAGHVDLTFAESGVARPLIGEGKVRGLAVSTSTRLPILPSVPTLAEETQMPDVETVSWHILFAPAATPAEIVERLHREMQQIMAAPEIRKRMTDMGQMPIDSPDVKGIRRYLASEHEKWGSLVRSLGLEGSQ